MQRDFMPTKRKSGQSDGAMEKKQGLRFVKCMVCHKYGIRIGANTDNFCKSFEPPEFLLTKNTTRVITLRKKQPEISALFLSAKQKLVISSTRIFSSINELTRVSYIPARNKVVIKAS